MTEIREFSSAVRRDEPIMFKLDGTDYGFRPPKEAIFVLNSRYEWLDQGLNSYDRAAALAAITTDDPAERTRQEEEINAKAWRGPTVTEIDRRLRDPEDTLDIDTLDEMIEHFREQVEGRPTT